MKNTGYPFQHHEYCWSISISYSVVFCVIFMIFWANFLCQLQQSKYCVDWFIIKITPFQVIVLYKIRLEIIVSWPFLFMQGHHHPVHRLVTQLVHVFCRHSVYQILHWLQLQGRSDNKGVSPAMQNKTSQIYIWYLNYPFLKFSVHWLCCWLNILNLPMNVSWLLPF